LLGDLRYAAAIVCVGVVDEMIVTKYGKAYTALQLLDALATLVDMNDDMYCLENVLGAVA
jgi:hypothetical protein